jgi:methionyl aminopeptidase
MFPGDEVWALQEVSVSIETQADLDGLTRAGQVVSRALRAMEDGLRVGMTTAELDAIAQHSLESAGARATPRHAVHFPGHSCISVNDEAVHGIPGDRRIEADDVVKIDVTADLDGYVADAARTIVVEPKSSERLRLAWCAKSSFQQSLSSARLGRRTDDIGAVVESEVKRQGFRVIRALCGHGVGRDLHEAPSVPNYREKRMSAPLTNGLVITIEPIISAGSGQAYEADDGWTVRTSDGALAAHFEETIVITRGAPRILTAA